MRLSGGCPRIGAPLRLLLLLLVLLVLLLLQSGGIGSGGGYGDGGWIEEGLRGHLAGHLDGGLTGRRMGLNRIQPRSRYGTGAAAAGDELQHLLHLRDPEKGRMDLIGIRRRCRKVLREKGVVRRGYCCQGMMEAVVALIGCLRRIRWRRRKSRECLLLLLLLLLLLRR